MSANRIPVDDLADALPDERIELAFDRARQRYDGLDLESEDFAAEFDFQLRRIVANNLVRDLEQHGLVRTEVDADGELHAYPIFD